MLQINASIVKYADRIWCVYRTNHLYGYNAECFLTELNVEMESISDRALLTENNNTAFEDVRLFAFGDKLFAFYTFMPFNDQGGWNWEYIVGLAELNVDTAMLENHVSLRYLSKRLNEKGASNEKNWVPYVCDDELFMVTDFDPFLRIIKIGRVDNLEPQEIYVSNRQTKGWDFGELRGGTPLLCEREDDDWRYGFIHSYRTHESGYQRFYYYTVVRFSHTQRIFEYYPQPLPYPDETPDEDYKLLWNYSNKGKLKVIFPIGLMHHDQGVMVSFGKDDVCSYTEYFSWERIRGYFDVK